MLIPAVSGLAELVQDGFHGVFATTWGEVPKLEVDVEYNEVVLTTIPSAPDF